MVFCTGCGKQLHETAPMCPHCGKPQHAGLPYVANAAVQKGPHWAAIASLVLGIIFALTIFDDSEWDGDEVAGVMMFSIVGLVLGIVGLNVSKRGRGVAIAGIVTSAVGCLSALSSGL